MVAGFFGVRHQKQALKIRATRASRFCDSWVPSYNVSFYLQK
jgi:hypothetical protein